MADIYVIGPDGFVTTRPASHNPDGSLRLSGTTSSYSYSQPSVKRSSKKKGTTQISSEKKTVNTNKSTINYNSTSGINQLLESWKNTNVVTEKAINRALSKIKSQYFRQYFEKTLAELESKCLITVRRSQSGSNSTAKTIKTIVHNNKTRVPSPIVNIREVDNLLKTININNSGAIYAAKERMKSFALRDYFDRKIAEAKLPKCKTESVQFKKREKPKSTSIVKSPKADSVCLSAPNNTVKPKNEITTTTEIDNLVKSWISCNGKISDKSIKKAQNRITSKVLLDYLDRKIDEYRFGRTANDSYSGHISLNQSSISKNYTTSSDHNDKVFSGVHGGRKPKYGYARDIFGRIQERDHYIEEKPVNKYNSSSSLYDSEDDNDSIYESSYDYD